MFSPLRPIPYAVTQQKMVKKVGRLILWEELTSSEKRLPPPTLQTVPYLALTINLHGPASLKKTASAEGFPRSDLPIDMSLGDCLN